MPSMFTPDDFFPQIPDKEFLEGKTFYGICIQRNPLQFIGFGNRILEVESIDLRDLKVSNIVLIRFNNFDVFPETIQTPPKMIIGKCEEMILCEYNKGKFLSKTNFNERFELDEHTTKLLMNLYNHWYYFYLSLVRYPLSLDISMMNQHIHSQIPIKNLLAYIISYSSQVSKHKTVLCLNCFFGYDHFYINDTIKNIVQEKRVVLDKLFEWKVPLPQCGNVYIVCLEKDQYEKFDIGDWIYLTDTLPFTGRDRRLYLKATKHSTVIAIKGNEQVIIERIGRLARQLPKDIILEMIKRVEEKYPKDECLKKYINVIKKLIHLKKIRSASTLLRKMNESTERTENVLKENIKNSSNEEKFKIASKGLNTIDFSEISEIKKDSEATVITDIVNKENKQKKIKQSQWFDEYSNRSTQSSGITLAPLGIQMVYCQQCCYTVEEIRNFTYNKIKEIEVMRIKCIVCKIYPENIDDCIEYKCGCIQRDHRKEDVQCQYCGKMIYEKYEMQLEIKDLITASTLLIEITHPTLLFIQNWFSYDPFLFIKEFRKYILQNPLIEVYVHPFYDAVNEKGHLYL
ncbi:hypothetical protein KM1_144080 [Entamoeba histolytica HM-3:IMSS]|uniref:Uncharacterized protein n=5 Tax=Entamoeba histolytica TaxID=5759 RepID=C4M1Y7_ENTH1|nr:hypothetical protein EHI_164940 [Entamoeba histolytica HM-1:IMSS]EAL49818.1 hypothetical protein EHI_164940 [Entamoeba histolytica HM-1:IMSS]EMD44697.1 Hypothetical protein EHI5A_119230 [Entamoeba histolytica KU27]EMS16128.1 hypothetical protein KM1_144080 [Entamoeba histolytica HM-3:IMSS]GAT95259.1 hypothetical protein CL6EHI_164940 [Entamoeba histolytica]|eukprot:XP_655204.1 hypothetical protein EHI_164940 [Entamoeba histolytica HM-1:IMSS]